MLRSETPVFGRIPQGATHWSIRKRGPLSWEWCTYAGREGVVQQEFGIGDLSITLIRKRWGAGTYRVMFVSLTRGARQIGKNQHAGIARVLRGDEFFRNQIHAIAQWRHQTQLGGA